MNITAHPVSPEEIMALMDDELPAAEAESVASHIATCTECKEVAEQFQSLAQSLASWEVEVVPSRVEQAVQQASVPDSAVAKVSQIKKAAKRKFWARRPWALAGMAAALIVAAIGFQVFSRHQSIESARMHAFLKPEDEINQEQRERLSMARPSEAIMTMPAPPPPPPATAYSYSNQPGGGGGGDRSESKQVVAADAAPMIARSVSLTIVVKDIAASRATLDAILARHHSYAAQLTINTPENAQRSFQASLRIPAPKLATALGDLKELGRVENETQSGEEVTQQHADLVARLKTARDTEERFRAILQQRTGKVEDVLAVEQEIARIRGEIESMEAEQKVLEHRVDFASVELTLSEEFKAQLNAPANSVSTRSHNAFVNGYQHASETVVGIALFFVEYGPTLLILAAIFGVPVWLLRRRYKKIQGKL